MAYQFEHELKAFLAFSSRQWDGHQVEKVDEFGFILRPRSGEMGLPDGKDIALTLMGIVHGDERVGLAVLNDVLATVASGHFAPPCSICFLLGNIEAGKQDKRFLERDLNRSFDRPGRETQEDIRARGLEGVLRRSFRMVDFHQVKRRTDRPFFIFPFQRGCYEFARAIAPQQTIVTHWGKPFSPEGQCSDEFVNQQGGIAITCELGQKGFSYPQTCMGTQVAQWAAKATAAALVGTRVERGLTRESGPVFRIADSIPWPQHGIVTLEEWQNFDPFPAGARIGTVAGVPIVAPTAGRIIFPQYIDEQGQRKMDKPPVDLCKVLHEVSEAELPS